MNYSEETISRVNELRAVLALRSHRFEHASDLPQLEMLRYLIARRSIAKFDLSKPLATTLRELNALSLGLEFAQFRQRNVQSRASGENAISHVNPISFRDVPRLVEEIEVRIFRNVSLDEFDRAALTPPAAPVGGYAVFGFSFHP